MAEIHGLHEADRDNTGGKELLRLTNDYVFKRTFAEENIDALAKFIASVTGIDVKELEAISAGDPNLHAYREGGKQGELDVRVHTKRGDIVNVEIQVKNARAFLRRIIYYNGRLFASQLDSGEDYGMLHRTVTIV
ncbi:MAG: Rpn family recombination-promoting nuclease/putative transposase, partial [Clostridiales Family XIII bacterium]|nr:Rpn family recombination-promoting nuclease/putative transposase [Clostridiales Family XIII bacterium]